MLSPQLHTNEYHREKNKHWATDMVASGDERKRDNSGDMSPEKVLRL